MYRMLSFLLALLGAVLTSVMVGTAAVVFLGAQPGSLPLALLDGVVLALALWALLWVRKAVG